MYLELMSLFHTDITQIVEILTPVRPYLWVNITAADDLAAGGVRE